MGFFGGFPLEFSRQSHVLHQFRRHPMGASPWRGTSFKPRKPRNKQSDGGGDVSSDDRTFQHTLPDLTWRYLRFRYITVHSLHDMTYIYNHIIYILITMIIHVLYIYIIIYNHIHIRYIYIYNKTAWYWKLPFYQCLAANNPLLGESNPSLELPISRRVFEKIWTTINHLTINGRLHQWTGWI